MNRRRPSRETPLRPGAKKDGCFRRLTKNSLITSLTIVFLYQTSKVFSFVIFGLRVNCGFPVLSHLKYLVSDYWSLVIMLSPPTCQQKGKQVWFHVQRNVILINDNKCRVIILTLDNDCTNWS